MCEHEFVEVQGTKMDYEKNDNGRIETLIRRKVCWKCYKTKTEIELEHRIEAAEKVCDAAVSYCNPDDDDVCYLDFVEIVERWQQEVNKCADQQPKK